MKQVEPLDCRIEARYPITATDETLREPAKILAYLGALAARGGEVEVRGRDMLEELHNPRITTVLTKKYGFRYRRNDWAAYAPANSVLRSLAKEFPADFQQLIERL